MFILLRLIRGIVSSLVQVMFSSRARRQSITEQCSLIFSWNLWQSLCSDIWVNIPEFSCKSWFKNVVCKLTAIFLRRQVWTCHTIVRVPACINLISLINIWLQTLLWHNTGSLLISMTIEWSYGNMCWFRSSPGAFIKARHTQGTFRKRIVMSVFVILLHAFQFI